MAGCRFTHGTHIKLWNHEYVIDRRLRNGDLRIQNVVTEEFAAFKETDLMKAFVDNELSFLTVNDHCNQVDRKALDFVVEDLSVLDDSDPEKKAKKEKLKRETVRKHRYVIEAVALRVPTLTSQSLRSVIDKVKEQIDDKLPPSWQTLRLWIKSFREAGDDVRALVPRDSAKGNRKRKIGYRRTTVLSGADEGKRRFTPEAEEKANKVVQIIEASINDVYLTGERHSIQEVADEVKARVIEDNRYRKANDQLPLPANSTTFRAVSKLDKYEVAKARYGQRYADSEFGSVGLGPRPKRPLEVVQMDSTTLDLFVIDPETSMPIGRPTLFVSSCLTTKMPHGCYTSFNETGHLAVSQCLLHGIMPKTYVKERYPKIKHEWECHGLFNSLKVDNAMAFHGESLEDAALQLGFLIDYAPIATPWFKAGIERFFGTLNRKLIHRQPGTTFSNIFQKFGYDPLKHALISKKIFDELIHIYLIDIFPREKHRGINDVPARLWKELIAKHPPMYPKKAEELRVLLGQVIWRTIQRTGIEIDGLYYRSDELASLRTKLLDNKGDVKKVKIKKNLEDLSVIHVQDEFRGRYTPVPAIDQEYTKGLTQFQHEVFMNYAKKRAEDFVKIEELHDAKQYIKQLVRDEWTSRKKGLLSKNTARLLNEDDLQPERSTAKNEVDVRSNSSTKSTESPRLNQEAVSGRGASNLGNALTSENIGKNPSVQGAGQKQNAENAHASCSKERMKGERSKSKTANRAQTAPRSKPRGNKSVDQIGGTVPENRAGWGVEFD